MSDLSAAFAPRGIVVVGASAQPGKLGTAMANALAGARAPVALVNSRGGEGFFTSVADAVDAIGIRGGTADLLVSCVPAAATPEVVRAAGAAGIRAALVCAGGFAEIGGEGERLQSEVARAASETGIRVIGPNTSGFFRPSELLSASFVPGVGDLAPGSVAVVASSGGVNHMLSFRLALAGVGISLGVGVGAGFDVTHADVLRFLADDEETAAVALHVESVDDGAALLDAVRAVAGRKPVVALVVGRREESAFAQSHTGSLATSWRTARSALAHAGAVVVDSVEQLITAVAALSRVRIDPTADAGVGLITAQAGPGLIIDDAAVAGGWSLPTLSEGTQTALAGLLPPLTFQANPVDTGRPAESFPAVLNAVAQDPAIDLLAVYALAEAVVDLPGAVVESGTTTPVILATDGPREQIERAQARASELGHPLVSGPTALAWAVEAVISDARARHRHGGTVVTDAPVVERGTWDEKQAKELLERIGIRTPAARVVTDLAGALAAREELHGGIAAKILDASILHKTEIGGVHLGIRDEQAMVDAVAALGRIGAERILVEQMADAGVDLVVSARRDPVFGPIVLLGIGGTAAEAIADVAIRTAPLTVGAAQSMIDDLHARDLLHGWRGGPAVDTAALGGTIAALGALLVKNPSIDEIEINPLRITHDGLVALDAVIIPATKEQ
ncbi:acetate--CoA ligase family protein [Microbacterium sp. ARD31]|uniref:acetate--CoA ligase family protein n=1 Tax=Microbacterium sp. ARD31 TaxID=2962576 RepID=UPI0028816CE3|nr:acetate--CoA ligase family protein [Microbacterium sp. ARD31]MDT0183980.1 acetate--CoA ligase family protein [Microbacterium sp. ARD31]